MLINILFFNYYFDFPIVTFMLFLDTGNLAASLGASASFLVITTMGVLFPLLLFRAVIQKYDTLWLLFIYMHVCFMQCTYAI